MNKWTLRQVDKLSKMYFEGKEDKELAKIFNTTERNIYNIRVELGLIDNCRLDWDEEHIKEYIKYQMGKTSSIKELSIILDLAIPTITRVLNKYLKEGYLKKREVRGFLNAI